MLGAAVCMISGHKVNRRRVWHDNVDYRTSCTRCSADLIRGRAGWRAYEEARDSSEGRRVHTRST